MNNMENKRPFVKGRIKIKRGASPSSSKAVKEALAANPHNNLLSNADDIEAAEAARRNDIYKIVKEMFHDGLLAYEILEEFPDERSWMADKIADWEVIYRREQLAFLDRQERTKPVFGEVKTAATKGDFLPMPPVDIDKPHLKAVGLKVTVWRSDTGEPVEELVWIPRSQMKDGMASRWIVDRIRADLEEKFPMSLVENLPG